eukprot:gnl/TRDRNA2_/TRDRNA2_161807_c0_seq1.p1 gnl/TRDRNA2_/TRDRNA2_161807_c0~~gnl/TRDRNA2_/TRDRNA2_161807_c0_seq1.p1  ORF type:complete len:205 (-),score=32.46 gnl/TRDRNA2_/TRDRNA2_161807_c0_seq1:127-741(-)
MARSSVFRSMFDSNMQEASSSRVQVEDTDLLTMKRFLHFVYTAEIPEEMIEEEYDVASWGMLANVGQKYDVPSLVHACVHQLKLWVNGKNVFEMLIIADQLRHKKFKKFCLEYSTKDAETLRLAQDSPFFEALSADLTREVLMYREGSYKRSRTDTYEFPDGTDWQRLTYVQLRRACDERGLTVLGERGELVAQLADKDEGAET